MIIKIIFRHAGIKTPAEPTHSGDDDEGDGDAGNDLGGHGSVGLLYEIPQADLVLDEAEDVEEDEDGEVDGEGVPPVLEDSQWDVLNLPG